MSCSSDLPTPVRHPRRTPPRRRLAALGLVLVAGLAATACQALPGAVPGGTAADCSDVPWGSAAKRVEVMSPSPIIRVRTGSQRCFDRMVVDLGRAPGAGWRVRYHAVTQPGSGAAVALRGNASLEVVALAPAHDATGSPTFRPKDPRELADVSGYRTFRQLAFAGSFEGETTFGLGVRTRLPFRVFAVEGPSGTKLVVDVAHRWP